MYVLINCGFFISNTISTRCKCWLAVAKLKVSEKPSVIALVQHCVDSVSVKQWLSERNIVGFYLPILFTVIQNNNGGNTVFSFFCLPVHLTFAIQPSGNTDIQ